MSTRLLIATLLAVGATTSSAQNSSAASSTVYIIRHGEKAWGGGAAAQIARQLMVVSQVVLTSGVKSEPTICPTCSTAKLRRATRPLRRPPPCSPTTTTRSLNVVRLGCIVICTDNDAALDACSTALLWAALVAFLFVAAQVALLPPPPHSEGAHSPPQTSTPSVHRSTLHPLCFSQKWCAERCWLKVSSISRALRIPIDFDHGYPSQLGGNSGAADAIRNASQTHRVIKVQFRPM